MNNLLLQALKKEKVSRPPVWLMRQAGRMLPEYRALRQQHSLWELFHTPELAARVTQMPISTLGVDAAILFSDILIVVEMLGYKITFPEKATPFVEKTGVYSSPTFVSQTIRILKPTLQVPLIGFCGGPYTVAKYMNAINHETLEKITKASIEYLQMQQEAGADVIQIFDSWAGLLPREEFLDFSLRYLEPLVASVSVPVIVFCRGSARYASDLISLNPSAISFDWEKDLADLRRSVPSHIAIQGNLDPDILKGPLPALEQAAKSLLASMKNERGYIFNLGHGVLPDTPVENAVRLVELVRQS